MPTYEYRCKECGHELEAVQSFKDEPLTECPSCGGPLRKKFAAPGIAFKGTGFYKNDSRSGSSSTASSSKASSSDASSTSSSTSSDSSGSTGSSSDGAGASSSSTGGSSSTTKAPAST